MAKTASPEFESAFTSLKSVFSSRHRKRMAVKVDTPAEYTLVGKVPSPFPQHKGAPLFVGAVRVGRAYVSLHLLALYMNPALLKSLSPDLRKRMQGKACFNFKSPPEKALLAELKRLADAGVKEWVQRGWL